MDIQLIAKNKLGSFISRKSEMISADDEYDSKIHWLKSAIEKYEAAHSQPEESPVPDEREEASLIIALDRKRVKNLLDEKFDRDGLFNLCFNLDINHENFSSRRKQTVIIELIQELERRNGLVKLLFELPKLNPSITWKDFSS